MAAETTTASAAQANGADGDHNLLVVKDLKKYFVSTKGVLKKTTNTVKAVDGVNFTLREGETLGLVGESGCGKTTTSRLIMRGYDPTGGEIRFKDSNLGWVDIPKLNSRQMHQVRQNVQMIFQDPYSSLNPRMTLLQIVG